MAGPSVYWWLTRDQHGPGSILPLEDVMSRVLTPARLVVAGLLLAVSGTGLQAQAVNADKDHLALYGYDAVAYQADNAAKQGSPEYVATYEGNTYRFATAAHRDAFKADPAKYVPA